MDILNEDIYKSHIHYPQFADMVYNPISNGEDMPQFRSSQKTLTPAASTLCQGVNYL
jgi:hypothetical protein